MSNESKPEINSTSVSKPLLICGSLIGLSLIAILIYFTQTYHKLRSVHQENLQALQQSLQQLQKAQHATNLKLANTTQEIEKLDLDSEKVQLYKVQYLLELANTHAMYVNNWETSVNLLREAYRVLNQLKNPRIKDLRSTVSKELTKLQTTPHVNYVDLINQIDILQESVLRLPLKQWQSSIPKIPSNTKASWFQKTLSHLSPLKSFIIVKHEDLTPPTSQSQSFVLRETAILQLQSAEWALLNHQSQLFKSILYKVHHLIENQFETNAVETIEVIEQLDVLRKTPIREPKLDLSESLQELNTLIQGESQ